MKSKSLILGMAALAMPLSLTIFSVAANAEPVYTGTQGGNIAVSGYDPVSYFEGDGEPVKGDAKLSFEYDGAVYQFANEKNKALFVADPKSYAPQYGGHCAWAAGRGYLAPGDPAQHEIVDGKLYLNFNADVKKKWDSDRDNWIIKGDKNWVEFPADAKFGDQK